MMIGSVNYAGVNVRVWYMFSGSVQHNYDSIRNNFMVELENLLGGRFGEFSTLDNFNKASFILGFENWNRDDFKAKALYY